MSLSLSVLACLSFLVREVQRIVVECKFYIISTRAIVKSCASSLLLRLLLASLSSTSSSIILSVKKVRIHPSKNALTDKRIRFSQLEQLLLYELFGATETAHHSVIIIRRIPVMEAHHPKIETRLAQPLLRIEKIFMVTRI